MIGFPSAIQGFGPVSKYIAATSNIPITAANVGNFIDITSGTFTQTFDTSLLTDTWSVFVQNSGTGDITIPSSDGVSNWVMYPNELRLFTWNGTALISKCLIPFFRTFTSTGTFTTPPGYLYFQGQAWSAGASGQRTNNVAVISVGGSGGGCFPFTFTRTQIGTTQTVTIGAGGAAVAGVAGGTTGGDTTIGTLLTIKGALNAQGGAVSTVFGATSAAICVGFDSSVSGNTARVAVYGGGMVSSNGSTDSANSVYGGGAGGSLDAAATVRAPSTSFFAGNGGAALSVASGADGVAPSGGGGATQTGTLSGAGARGEVRIWGIM